ncbi:TPR-like protein [Wilcoxina mikolae CBS 423.85]|nr:TPR-like protein [Wilcoxina mikolae CBS 423.85]
MDDLDIPIGKYTPRWNGAILFTTRDRRLVQKYKTDEIRLDVLSNDQAVETFVKLVGSDRQSHLVTEVERLHQLLDRLPLAIAQAAAYIRETTAPPDSLQAALSEYNRLCDDEMNKKELLSEQIQTEMPDTYHSPLRSVMTTWEITIQRIQRINPSSIQLLQLMYLLDPDEIPRDLLQSSSHPDLASELLFSHAMRHLQRYSLVTALKDNSYRTHRLGGMIALLDSYCSLLHNVTRHLRARGSFGESLVWAQLTLDSYENTLRKDHPFALSIASIIAVILYDQGEYSKALEWNKIALDGRVKALGMDYPETLTEVNNRAMIFLLQREYEKALELLQLALDGREKTLGKDYTYTLITVNNMASLFFHQGDYREALECILGDYMKALEWHQRTLDGCENALEKDHHQTLAIIENIAKVFYQQGEYSKALEWYQRVLNGREKVLGKDHFKTLQTIKMIANTRIHLYTPKHTDGNSLVLGGGG